MCIKQKKKYHISLDLCGCAWVCVIWRAETPAVLAYMRGICGGLGVCRMGFPIGLCVKRKSIHPRR